MCVINKTGFGDTRRVETRLFFYLNAINIIMNVYVFFFFLDVSLVFDIFH